MEGNLAAPAVQGSVTQRDTVVYVSASTTLNPWEQVCIITATCTITLPDPSLCIGRHFLVTCSGNVTLTLAVPSNTNYVGSTSVWDTDGDYVICISNGINYYTVQTFTST